jgi:hypothetical protein
MAVALCLGALPAVPRAEDAAASVAAPAGDPPSLAVEARVGREAPPEHGKAFCNDATPVEPGSAEIELAYAPSWWAVTGDVGRAQGSAHPLVLAVGLGLVPGLDVRVAAGWAARAELAAGIPQSGYGLSDTAVALRWRFLSLPQPGLDLAVVAGALIPTGTRTTPESLGTSQESWSVAGALVASADRGAWTVNAELGWSFPIRPGGSDDVGLILANLALGHQVLPWLQPEVELNYQHEIERGPAPDERVLWCGAGLVLPVAPVRVVIGARFPAWQRHAAAGPTGTAAVKLAF